MNSLVTGVAVSVLPQLIVEVLTDCLNNNAMSFSIQIVYLVNYEKRKHIIRTITCPLWM
jgi:hypothetical protein